MSKKEEEKGHSIFLPDELQQMARQFFAMQNEYRAAIRGFVLGTPGSDPAAIYDITPDFTALVKRQSNE